MPYCPECGRKYRDGSYLCPSCNRTLVDVLAPRNEGAARGGRPIVYGAGTSARAEGNVAPDRQSVELDCVGVYYGELDAQMAAALLRTSDIPYLFKRATEGPCYLYVRREDVGVAQKLLGSPPKGLELTEEEI